MKPTIFVLMSVCMLLCIGFDSWGAQEPILYPKALRPTTTKKGYAILVLGSTSVGKTYISKRITSFLSKIKNLPEVVTVKMDAEYDRQIPPTIKQEFPADWQSEQIMLYQTIVEHSLKGEIVVCDIMLFASPTFDITESFISKLKQTTNVFSILVYCTLDQLLKNVSDRNDSGDVFESRSPVGAVEQYIDMYCSPPLDTVQSEQIGSVSPVDCEEGITALTSLTIPSYEQRARTRCIGKLQDLRDRAPSPILMNKNLYEYVIKNDEYDLETEIARICFKLIDLLPTG